MALSIYLTSSCNMNCRYCFNWEDDGQAGASEIAFDDVCRIIDAAKSIGTRYVTITGGEPFVYGRIFDVLDYAHDSGMWVNVLTNGTLLDPEKAALLKKYWRMTVRVSMEGATRNIHEFFRGKGSYDRVVAAVDALAAGGVSTAIGMTVYEENVDDIDVMVRFCIEKGCRYLRMVPVMRIARGKKAKMDISLYEKILAKNVEMMIKHRAHVDFEGADSGAAIPLEVLTTAGCCAGLQFFGVSPDMTIVPCPLIRKEARVFRKPFTTAEDFEDVRNHMEKILSSIKSQAKGACASCEYLISCGGGCIAEKLNFELDINDEQPVCVRDILRKILDGCDERDARMIVGSWYNRKKTRLEEPNCMRHAPFWSIYFKRDYGRYSQSGATCNY